MKLIAFLKITLKGMIKELPQYVIVLLLLPLLMALGMSLMMNDLFSAETKYNAIDVAIVDKDNTTLSESFINYLQDENISTMINIEENKDDVDYIINIPNGYEENLLSSRKNIIELSVKSGGSKTSSAVITSVIDLFNKEIDKSNLINENISNMNLTDDEKQELLNKITTEINKINTSKLINSEVIKVDKALSSSEYYGIVGLGFLILMLISSMGGSSFLPETRGYSIRMGTLPLTRFERYNYDLASNFLMSFVISAIYIGILRTLGKAFTGPLWMISLVLVIVSIIISIVAVIITELLNKKSFNIIINVITILWVVASGMIPMDKITDIEFLQKIKVLSPDHLINTTLTRIELYSDFSSIKNNILIMLISAVIIYIIGALIENKKKRRLNI